MTEFVRISNEIFTILELCTDQECDEWIAQSESLGYEEASINSEQGPKRMPSVRNNDRVIVDDKALADELWNRIACYIPSSMKGWEAVGLNERLRYYRYDVGQKFSWHADGCVRLGNGLQSMLTFMVYLNADFAGGETLFRKGVRIEPQKGMALLFCHWQKHMGDEVSEGLKYVLRSDVMYTKVI